MMAATAFTAFADVTGAALGVIGATQLLRIGQVRLALGGIPVEPLVAH